ncbi:MAG: hypothetical protein Q4C45_05145 [Oscillospiraceae bacterium]|nr:hypothetical protein [Oscillospiraceae bacterium]
MKNEDFYAPWQPYSQSLRTIAILIETRENDADCVAQIKRFLERSGVPVRDRSS